MAGVKGMKMNTRSRSISLIMRVDESMDHDLRILYGFDKKAIGSISFNQWLVLQLSRVIESRQDRIALYNSLISSSGSESSK